MEISDIHFDSNSPSDIKVFETVKNEETLLMFEMTPQELAYAVNINRASRKEILKDRLLSPILLILAVLFALGLVYYFWMHDSEVNQDIAIKLLLVVVLMYIPGIGVDNFRIIKKVPQIYLTYSGVYFLGHLYAFRLQKCFLSSAQYIEPSADEPAILRLSVNNRTNSHISIEIPLRPEMVIQANTIIKTLLPE